MARSERFQSNKQKLASLEEHIKQLEDMNSDRNTNFLFIRNSVTNMVQVIHYFCLVSRCEINIFVCQVTESYSSSQDPPERSIPICTLKNFPNAIEHTLQWARDMFEGTFTQAPLTASQYVEDATFKEKTLALPGAQPLETFQTVKKLILLEKPNDFRECVAWARLLWQELFHNQIAQLLHNFPHDQVF